MSTEGQAAEQPWGKPYKGLESYQPEDGQLFYGRDNEAAHLLSTVLSSTLTVLHAGSGTGKTSLLNARLIPDLEARGWSPVRILLQDDPVESVRFTTLRALLPPPETEVTALERARKALDLAREDTLLSLLEAFDGLDDDHPDKRRLITRIDCPEDSANGILPPFGLVDPMVCRLLRKSIEVATLAEHLVAIRQGIDDTPIRGGGPNLGPESSLGEILDLLSEPDLTAAYLDLLAWLYPPVRDLRTFFENLTETLGPRLYRRQPGFSLVLIFDQFEELFTRYLDPGPAPSPAITASKLPSWELRDELFEQLEVLYRLARGQSATGRAGGGENQLPLRFVLSLREDYLANLEPIRLFAGALEVSQFRLDLLEVDQAEQAIRQPAEIYGYTYEPECYRVLIAELTKEKRFVETMHLQIVCEKLWTEKGKALAAKPNEGDGLPEIEKKVFDSLRGVEGILRSFLREFLDTLEKADRLEALEMLEMLITASGTRNIVENKELVDAPLRNLERRKKLFAKLVNRGLIRTERRLGGLFAEITHEFLIRSVLRTVRQEMQENPDYLRLREAVQALARFESMDFRDATGGAVLPLADLQTLSANAHRLDWPPWAVELMLRSALVYGAADPSMIETWAERYRTLEVPDLDSTSIGPRDGVEARLLSEAELVSLYRRRDELELDPRQLETILRSELRRATPERRDAVRHWARKAWSAWNSNP